VPAGGGIALDLATGLEAIAEAPQAMTGLEKRGLRMVRRVANSALAPYHQRLGAWCILMQSLLRLSRCRKGSRLPAPAQNTAIEPDASHEKRPLAGLRLSRSQRYFAAEHPEEHVATLDD
jgi:hypothetical protein